MLQCLIKMDLPLHLGSCSAGFPFAKLLKTHGGRVYPLAVRIDLPLFRRTFSRRDCYRSNAIHCRSLAPLSAPRYRKYPLPDITAGLTVINKCSFGSSSRQRRRYWPVELLESTLRRGKAAKRDGASSVSAGLCWSRSRVADHAIPIKPLPACNTG